MDKQEFNSILLKIEIVEMDDVIRSPELMKTCRNLTLYPRSGMNMALNAFTRLSETRSIDALALFASYAGETVAWLLFGYEEDGFEFRPKEGDAFSHVYVREDYRRLGIGSRLQRMAAKIAEPDIVRVYNDYCPVNYTRGSNYEFFKRAMQTNTNIKSLRYSDNQQ